MSDFGDADYEARRLAVLADYAIVDTPPEQDFDDIVQLASHICGTPIALVSLVESNRQWFKARVGIDASETPINQSVCSLGLCQTEPLIIPDLTADPRTAGNSLVSGETGLRFYAGAPLSAPGGEVIGMLCVIDVAARPAGIGAEQKLALTALARQVMVQIELRKAIERQKQAEAERQLLNEELSHRLKNTLAMVQSMANQTLKDVSDRAAVEAFESRLLALSSAHDVLLQDSWASARIHVIVVGSLSLLAASDRFAVEGPETTLGPRGALSVSMLLHELGTNAVKYGAWSSHRGHVLVRWAIDADGEAPEFVLDWIERGGPRVGPPVQKGFGSKLIAMGLSGARKVREEYTDLGYAARFRAPLARMREA